jgi:hypothetical protein
MHVVNLSVAAVARVHELVGAPNALCLRTPVFELFVATDTPLGTRRESFFFFFFFLTFFFFFFFFFFLFAEVEAWVIALDKGITERLADGERYFLSILSNISSH